MAPYVTSNRVNAESALGGQYVQYIQGFSEAPQEEKEVATTRVVKVFIVDPDEKLPVADRLLYKGDEQVTDLTDQELFFELDIKSLLEVHNAKRVRVKDKEASTKDSVEYLEPARVRDLVMSVVIVAKFEAA